jgi:hypothetical protein
VISHALLIRLDMVHSLARDRQAPILEVRVALV